MLTVFVPFDIETLVATWPEVREANMLAGETDFLLKCVAKDLSAFQSFVTDVVTADKNVARAKTALVIHASKNEPGVPLEVKG